MIELGRGEGSLRRRMAASAAPNRIVRPAIARTSFFPPPPPSARASRRAGKKNRSVTEALSAPKLFIAHGSGRAKKPGKTDLRGEAIRRRPTQRRLGRTRSRMEPHPGRLAFPRPLRFWGIQRPRRTRILPLASPSSPSRSDPLGFCGRRADHCPLTAEVRSMTDPAYPLKPKKSR